MIETRMLKSAIREKSKFAPIGF